MTRNLKVLGLALVAALALSVAFSSAAQAAPKLTCEVYPCVITGEAIEHTEIGAVHLFTTNTGQKVSCKLTHFDATIEKESGNERVTVTPTYEECTATGGGIVTVTMNECDYELYGGAEDKANHFVNGTTDIVCPPEKKIEVHIYTNATEHKNGKSACTITIGPQKELHGNTYENTEKVSPDDVDLTTTIEGIAVTGDGILCSSAKTATYTGGTTLRAYKDLGRDPGPPPVYTEGTQIKLTVSK